MAQISLPESSKGKKLSGTTESGASNRPDLVSRFIIRFYFDRSSPNILAFILVFLKRIEFIYQKNQLTHINLFKPWKIYQM